MGLLQHAAAIPSGASAYNIDNSLKLERGNSEKLSRTPSSASNSKTWTYSFWLKRTQLGINSYHLEAKGSGDRFFILGFNENDNLLIYDIYSDDYGKVLRMKFRDIAAWYHIVLAIDTTDGTAGNRNKFYVNGVLVTDYVTDYGDFPQNHDTQINKAVVHNIGYRTDINQYASGYQAETCLVDGAALAPTSFGEFDDSGIWKPIDVTELTFGTNGFYQEYESGSALGDDTVPGGNSIDYAASNIAAADQATDTPTNNFCTLNPLIPYAVQSGSPVISKGSTFHNGSGGWTGMKGTIGINKGKWYWELSMGGAGGGVSVIYGIQTVTSASGESTATSAHDLLETAAWYVNGGHWIKDETSGRDDVAAGSVTHTPGNTVVYAVALNMDDGEITYYANGSAITNLTDLDLDGLDGETVAPFASVYNQQA